MYENNKTPRLSDELFKNPTAEYRGTPFWAWNCELKKDELLWQIEELKKMGFGGAHMHVRTGMATTYLSDEHMGLIKACVDKAKSEHMLAYLYDEDRWPSGAAGGYVTKDKKYRARYLLFTETPYSEDEKAESTDTSSAVANRTGNGRLIGVWDVCLDDAGCLKSYKRIGENDAAEGMKWYAYLETPKENPWYNNQTYANTLDPETIEKFVDVTYNAYLKTCGDEFGKTVPSIFTDEPQFSHKTTLRYAKEKSDVILPWTDDIPETYEKAYGADILETLPELIWEKPDGEVSVARYRYHDHIAERFSSAFADICGSWCKEHNLMLTGHMMEEPTLKSQTAALGEAMRSYRSFGLPGIDMLCDSREYTTAKQACSATRQFGYPGVLSELYGVTNWDFDFRGHKLQGDWQAALGVTTRVPHLAWVSMAGEAKRDYPASINYQSPWYKEYPYVENHFARVNTAMTRGKAVVRVGVVHPIESYWLHWGPSEQTGLVRDEMDTRFQNLTNWLIKGAVDFDFISESLLPIQCAKAENPFNVGEMHYDVVVVPACETLRSSTLERLEAFRKAGGRLVFLGDAPKYENAVPSERGAKLCAESETVEFSQGAIINALESVRTVGLRNPDGSMTNDLIYQMREDNGCRWLFIANGNKEKNKDIASGREVRITVAGEWKPTEYDTLSGEKRAAAAEYALGNTVVRRMMYEEDSLLLFLEPGRAETKACGCAESEKGSAWIASDAPYSLSEPNVLLLDMAESKLDDGAWLPKEEILRLDNIHRKALGWPSRQDAVAQPWVVPNEAPTHTVTLRIEVESDIDYVGASLAIEDAEKLAITWNGEAVPSVLTGYFTDKSIKTVAIPPIRKGINELIVEIPYSRRANIEWCYLLGDFGVDLRGTRACIVPKAARLAFDDITRQGLPFYGANVTHHAVLTVTKAGEISVRIPHYRGALIAVAIDGRDCGRIVYEPYTLSLGELTVGEHKLDVTAFGNRHNSFAPLHMADATRSWFGPDGWRTKGDEWCYEYRIKPTGILSTPRIV